MVPGMKPQAQDGKTAGGDAFASTLATTAVEADARRFGERLLTLMDEAAV